MLDDGTMGAVAKWPNGPIMQAEPPIMSAAISPA